MLTQPDQPGEGSLAEIFKGEPDITQPREGLATPIQNVELELEVLGGLMHDGDQAGDVSRIIQAEDFTSGLHQTIYELILKLFNSGQPITPRILKSFVGKVPLGEIDTHEYIQRLYESTASPMLTKQFAEQIRALSLRRMLLGVGQEIEDMAFSADPTIKSEALVDNAEAIIANCRQQFRRQGHDLTMGRIYDNAMQAARDAMNANEPIGHKWFLPDLQDVTGARIQKAFLIGLMAPSGGGKSSMILRQLYYSAAVCGVPSIFFSYEQDEDQCFYQMCSQQLGFETLDIQNNKLSAANLDRMEEQNQILRKAPLKIEKVYGLGAAELAARARAFHRIHGPGIVAIDHAKRIAPADYRAGLHQQVNQIYGDLKNLALDLDSSVFLLMQQNSDARRRSRPAPIKSDAYGGDGAAENLDCLIGLWREEEWVKSQIRLAERDDQKDRLRDRLLKVEGKAEIVGLKVRYGQAGIARKIRYSKEFTRFESFREPDPQEGFRL